MGKYYVAGIPFDSENSLSHHGVKGMEWNKHKFGLDADTRFIKWINPNDINVGSYSKYGKMAEAAAKQKYGAAAPTPKGRLTTVYNKQSVMNSRDRAVQNMNRQKWNNSPIGKASNFVTGTANRAGKAIGTAANAVGNWAGQQAKNVSNFVDENVTGNYYKQNAKEWQDALANRPANNKLVESPHGMMTTPFEAERQIRNNLESHKNSIAGRVGNAVTGNSDRQIAESLRRTADIQDDPTSPMHASTPQFYPENLRKEADEYQKAANNALVPSVQRAANAVANSAPVQAVGEAARNAGNAVSGAVNAAGDWVGQQAQNVGEFARNLPGNIADAARGAGDWVGQQAQNVGNTVGPAAEQARGGIGGFFDRVGNTVSGAARGVGDWASNAARDVGNWAGQAAQDVGGAVSGAAQNVGNAARDVGGAVSGAANKAAEGAKGFLNSAGQWVSGAANNVKNTASKAASDAKKGASGFLNSAGQWVSNAAGNVKNAAQNVGNTVGQAAQNVSNAVGQAAQNVGEFVTGRNANENLERLYAENIANGGNGMSPELDEARAQYNRTLPGMAEWARDNLRENVGYEVEDAARNAGNWIGNQTKNVGQAVSGAAGNVADWARNVPGNITGAAQGVGDWARNVPGNVGNFVDQNITGNSARAEANRYNNFAQNPNTDSVQQLMNQRAAENAQARADNTLFGRVGNAAGAVGDFARNLPGNIAGAAQNVGGAISGAANNVGEFFTGRNANANLERLYAENIANGGNGMSPELTAARAQYNRTLPGMAEWAVDNVRERVIPDIEEAISGAANSVGQQAQKVSNWYTGQPNADRAEAIDRQVQEYERMGDMMYDRGMNNEGARYHQLAANLGRAADANQAMYDNAPRQQLSGIAGNVADWWNRRNPFVQHSAIDEKPDGVSDAFWEKFTADGGTREDYERDWR